MNYRIEISSIAEAEADSAFLRLSQISSSVKASQWYAGLLEAIASLSQMPKRCPLARENEHFSQELRQLLYGRGRNSYRNLGDQQTPVGVVGRFLGIGNGHYLIITVYEITELEV
jgi:plasmid stabilization system protein ParE